MSDIKINDYSLDKLAEDCADEIRREVRDHGGNADDLACQYADDSEWAIYHHKAHQLCQDCTLWYGEEFLEEIGPPSPVTYDGIACLIAYGELLGRIRCHLENAEENAA